MARLAQSHTAQGAPARPSARALRECRRSVRPLACTERRRAVHRGAPPPPTARRGLACTGGDDPGGRPMRRASLFLALTLLATVLASGTAAGWAAPRAAGLRAAVVAPQLQRQLDAVGQDEMVKAIVVLKSQADLASVHRLARKDRPGAAARILRAHADLTQRALRTLLQRRRAQGLVSDIEPLWIVNAIAVTATPAVISELAAHPDVREIR